MKFISTRLQQLAFLSGLLICSSFLPIYAQSAAPTVKLWDGIAVAGYVDKGAYINFTGPAIKWTRKPYSVLLGVLPTLKIKKDNSAVKNALITPTLGAGATFVFKHFVVQLPVYYQPKSATVNGRWRPGIGIGIKL